MPVVVGNRRLLPAHALPIGLSLKPYCVNAYNVAVPRFMHNRNSIPVCRLGSWDYSRAEVWPNRTKQCVNDGTITIGVPRVTNWPRSLSLMRDFVSCSRRRIC